MSVCVHAFPSLHVVPSVFAGFEQVPFAGEQVPALWHWSLAVQVTGLEPVQVPAWQLSISVQAFPSLQEVPSAFAGFEHTPVAGLQIPATWHWSGPGQTTGLLPTQLPDWQVSVLVQALASLHELPFAFRGFEQIPLEGLQVPATWHWSSG